MIFQVRSDPATVLQIGSTVELYSLEGRYMGISRRIEALRMPEGDSVDFVLQSVARDEQVIILNASIALGWVALPAWASAIRYIFRSKLPDTYDQPRVVLRPRDPQIKPALEAHTAMGKLSAHHRSTRTHAQP